MIYSSSRSVRLLTSLFQPKPWSAKSIWDSDLKYIGVQIGLVAICLIIRPILYWLLCESFCGFVQVCDRSTPETENMSPHQKFGLTMHIVQPHFHHDNVIQSSQ